MDYQRFLARLTPEQLQQWTEACEVFERKFGAELAARQQQEDEDEDEPCCRPEHCPHQPEFDGHVVSWAGSGEHHVCCLCAERG